MNTKHVFQGMEFDSAESMQLFIDSRTKHSKGAQSTPAKNDRFIGALVWLITGAAIFATLAQCTSKSELSEKAEAIKNAKPTQSARVSADALEKMAMLINFNGKLCARVNDITKTGPAQYQVQCTEYRDGGGIANYSVDMTTGRVSP